MYLGRQELVKDPTVLEALADELHLSENEECWPVLIALQKLQVKRWVYLKDTRYYSVFIDVIDKQAFAVSGLTQRLRDITGGSGVLIETGLLPYSGCYVCDGLLTRGPWLGPGVRREYDDVLREIKANGMFHRAPEAAAPADALGKKRAVKDTALRLIR